MQKELDQLRAKLDSLRRREYELVQELIDIRAAAEIQSKKIDDILKMQSVAVIDRLPVEILSRILHFALSVTRYNEWERHPLWRGQFAGVSHRWRDVILNSPSFWTAICVGFGCSSSYIKMQLARSRELPLDITIRQGFSPKELADPLRCAHRWRSLTIRYLFTRRSGRLVRYLLDDLWGLSFPRLKYCMSKVTDVLTSNS